MTYFEEGSEAVVKLESMVDAVGVRNVLYALAHIGFAKGDHIRSNWQDNSLVLTWDNIAARIETFANKTRGWSLGTN